MIHADQGATLVSIATEVFKNNQILAFVIKTSLWLY